MAENKKDGFVDADGIHVTEKKKPFIIFCDFEGVLNGTVYSNSLSTVAYFHGKHLPYLDSSNVNCLENLLTALQLHDYQPELYNISSLRNNMQQCKDFLLDIRAKCLNWKAAPYSLSYMGDRYFDRANGRGMGIADVLKQYPGIEYIVLDDNAGLIKTIPESHKFAPSSELGLTSKNIVEIMDKVLENSRNHSEKAVKAQEVLAAAADAAKVHRFKTRFLPGDDNPDVIREVKVNHSRRLNEHPEK